VVLVSTRASFWDLPEDAQERLLVFHARAKNVAKRTSGISGSIVMMDNDECVLPRQVAAKYPVLSGKLTPERDVRFGSEAEVASDLGLAAGSTSDVVSLDRNRRSREPAQATSVLLS
jgi:hypothetical protein